MGLKRSCIRLAFPSWQRSRRSLVCTNYRPSLNQYLGGNRSYGIHPNRCSLTKASLKSEAAIKLLPGTAPPFQNTPYNKMPTPKLSCPCAPLLSPAFGLFPWQPRKMPLIHTQLHTRQDLGTSLNPTLFTRGTKSVFTKTRKTSRAQSEREIKRYINKREVGGEFGKGSKNNGPSERGWGELP